MFIIYNINNFLFNNICLLKYCLSNIEKQARERKDKMGRPVLKLFQWCHQDVDLKIEFLDMECKKNDGLVKFITNPNGYTFIGEPKYLDQEILADEKPIFQDSILANGYAIRISNTCFNQLKKQFTKYKKEKTTISLVKKQYHFEKELSTRIQNIKKMNGWAKEEYVIEYLVNGYCNQITQYKTKVEIETKPIKFKMLNDEINKNNLEISQLKTEVFQLNQKLLKETSAKEYYQNLCKKHGIEETDT